MRKPLKYFLIRLSGIIVGLTLLLSGIFKLEDPVGTGLIVDSYWQFFHLGFLSPLSKAAGWALSLFEASLGAMLVIGVFKRFSSWAATILIAFFTIITLLLWIFNPEMDCGCFGKVISLTHGQSLLKNIALLALSAGVVLPTKGGFNLKKRRRYPAFALLEGGILFGALYTLFTIPVVDFTPFKPGIEIVGDYSGESGDNGREMTYIYEKDGVRSEFAISEIPDSSWTYVGTGARTGDTKGDDDALVLSFSDASGEICDHLATRDNVMIFSVYDPAGAGESFWRKTAGRMQDAESAGFKSLLLTAATHEGMENELRDCGEAVSSFILSNCYTADRKTLLSLNRANGGATWMHDGMLVKKWAGCQYPDRDGLSSLMKEDPVERMMDAETGGRIRFDAFLLYCLAVALLF